MTARAHSSQAGKQSGSMLLESFIAILIFSMGILAIVGMQASAIKNSTDSRYRSEAAQLANSLLGQMWVSNRFSLVPNNPQPCLQLQANFEGGIGGADGALYTAWSTNARDVLPGAAVNPPRVTVNPATCLVTVMVLWKAPNEPATDAAHNYLIVTQLD
jgi:type IV pilus assembly protein PilV